MNAPSPQIPGAPAGADTRIECPHCRTHLIFGPECDGTVVACPACGGAIKLPGAQLAPILPGGSAAPNAARDAAHFRGPPHDCARCGGKLDVIRKYPTQTAGILICLVGLFLAPLLIGIPLLIIGLVVWHSSEAWWVCTRCGSQVPYVRPREERIVLAVLAVLVGLACWWVFRQ